jgi:plastocyanin
MRKVCILFGALILAIGVVSCGGGDTVTQPPTCPANTFCLESSSFFPLTLSVPSGTTVTWQNDRNNPSEGGLFHTVLWDDAAGSAAAGAGDGTGDIVDASATHTRRFTTAGTYSFHCNVHPGMSGTLTVTP